MGKVLEALDDNLIAFISQQPLFFVATAPSSGGHVNVSPKGLDTFAVLDPLTVAYLDLTGSGIETAAHLRDNGRITLMFCAFSGPPQILRLYGRGEVLAHGSAGFDELRPRFGDHPGARAIMRIEVDRVSTSCGYSIPLLRYEGDRALLDQWAERKGEDGLAAYRAEKNVRSIDGLEGLPVA